MEIDAPLQSHAQLYAVDGFEVFPLKADKTPYVSQHLATTDLDQIARWWLDWPTALIGCRLHQTDIILDIDPRHGGARTWKALVGEFSIPRTRTHLSGRGDGGGHTWWLRPEGHLSVRALDSWAQNRGLGESVGGLRWSGGIDILQRDHRYTILPPSPHPDTGAPYEWLRGVDWLPQALPGGLAALLLAAPPERAERAPATIFDDRDSIADWFSESASWRSILEPHGWTCVEGDGESDGSKWRHPEASNSFSATVSNDGTLFVYSPRTPFQVTEPGSPHGYRRFGAWGLLEHRGDLSEAASAARRLKDGDRISVTSTSGALELVTADLDEIGWRPVDLGSVYAGNVAQPVPSVLRIADAEAALFYAGKVNGLYGDSGTGKTWIALQAIAEEIRGGRKAVLIDYEATGAEAVARLRLLGLTDDQMRERLTYFNPVGRRSDLALAPLLAEVGPETGIVVIDSVGEAFGEEGIDENVDLDVGSWMREYPRRIGDIGPAVVWIDHLTKAAENPWHPSGSKRKKASITGAIYRVETNSPPTKTRNGTLWIKCAKDRHGTFAAKATVAIADIEHRLVGGGLLVTLKQPPERADEEVDPKAERIVAEVVAVLVEEGEPMSQNALTLRIGGRAADVRGALDLGVMRGALIESKGTRGARLFSPRPTSSHLVPDEVDDFVP